MDEFENGSEDSGDQKLTGELLIVPPSFLKSPQAEILHNDFETAVASGWMATRRPEYSQGGPDRGFVISDHADWNDLVQTIQETGARRVYVQHRGHGALVRHLKGLGLKAFPDSHLAPANPDQLSFL